jgi:hypothetical protein
MKLKKSLIMLSIAFAMVVMLLSCTSYKRPTITWPTTLPTAIETSMIEVTGDKGETLRIEFDRDTGRCKESFVNGEPTNCKGFELSDTYYCTPPDNWHPANTDMNHDGKPDSYCGNVKFLTEGADIQFEAESAAGNKKCKNVGGYVICY